MDPESRRFGVNIDRRVIDVVIVIVVICGVISDSSGLEVEMAP
jgi:hypothetical protein